MRKYCRGVTAPPDGPGVMPLRGVRRAPEEVRGVAVRRVSHTAERSGGIGVACLYKRLIYRCL